MNAYIPVQATEVDTDTADAQGLTALENRRLMGFAVRDTNGAAASVVLRHGTADTDPVVGVASVPADSTDQQWFGPNGIEVPDGLFVERTAGETHLVLYWLIGN